MEQCSDGIERALCTEGIAWLIRYVQKYGLLVIKIVFHMGLCFPLIDNIPPTETTPGNEGVLGAHKSHGICEIAAPKSCKVQNSGT